MPLRRSRPEDKSQQWRPRKSVRLYLDDLDEILAVMRQVDSEVHIITPEHLGTIDNAEELKEAAGPGTLDSVDLLAGSWESGVAIRAWDELRGGSVSDEPAIFVRLARPVVVRITPRDDLTLAGAGRAIHDLLSRRQTRTGGWALGSTATTDDIYRPTYQLRDFSQRPRLLSS